jgi:hypothetical protein
MKTTFVALLLLAISFSPPAFADDAAASIGAGGLVVLNREDRITMAREVLTISLKKVKVDYEFRNDSDEDVTTIVAFPIPSYTLQAEERYIKEQGFDDFRLSIEGKPAQFQVESRAKLKGVDVTTTLNKYGIDVATFGHFNEDRHQSQDIRRLTNVQRSAFVKAALIDTDPSQDFANWAVEKKYYWSQKFPAHSTVHISHEYTPVVGYNYVSTDEFRAIGPNAPASVRDKNMIDKFILNELKAVCLNEGLRHNLESASVHSKEGYGFIQYVDFILMSANTWKQPIVDFTLFVEKPPAEKYNREVVSFCWPGPVEKVGPDLFKATAINLIPQRELKIGFFHAEVINPKP